MDLSADPQLPFALPVLPLPTTWDVLAMAAFDGWLSDERWLRPVVPA